jgi:hypothetical protein
VQQAVDDQAEFAPGRQDRASLIFKPCQRSQDVPGRAEKRLARPLRRAHDDSGMIARVCPHCGTAFETIIQTHRFCCKACRMAAYFAANRDRIAQRKAAYYVASWEMFEAYRVANREKRAAYYTANRDRIAKCKAADEAENRDEIAKHKAAHYAANREAILKRSAAYRAANRDKILKRKAAYRAAKRDRLKLGKT